MRDTCVTEISRCNLVGSVTEDDNVITSQQIARKTTETFK